MTYPGFDISIWEMAGLTGALIYCVGYVCAAFDRIPSQCVLFYVLRLIAAGLVLVSLTNAFNLASAVIQVFFICVSVVGVIRHLGRSRRTPVEPVEEPILVVPPVQASTADRNCFNRSEVG